MSYSKPTVCVIGLGKLGAPLAACFAARGHAVIGVDQNPEVVTQMASGSAPVREPELERLLRANRERLTATTDTVAAVSRSEITFVIVPTPSQEDGSFSLDYVLEALKRTGEAIRKSRSFHLVVLTSTVLPGSMNERIRPAIEGASGKRCGVDFGLCYSPEFVALGDVVRGILRPDFVLIGESDERSGQALEVFYRGVLENQAPVARMSWVNAELTKIALNTFVTTKISYANMLAETCERLPGADVDQVAGALGLDSRIGRKYLKGALGYGGPCFPRDNAAFASLARRLGVAAEIAEATDATNKRQVERLERRVLSLLHKGRSVGILGLAYKPRTNVVERSQGLELARRLIELGVPTVVFDPEATDNARAALGAGARFAASARECARSASVLVIATPWEQFRGIEPDDLARSDGRAVLIDCWRLLDRDRFSRVVDYVALGVGEEK